MSMWIVDVLIVCYPEIYSSYIFLKTPNQGFGLRAETTILLFFIIFFFLKFLSFYR